MNNGVVMRCDNCKNGIIRYKNAISHVFRNSSKIEKVYCGEFHKEVKLEAFRKLRYCQWFDVKE